MAINSYNAGYRYAEKVALNKAKLSIEDEKQRLSDKHPDFDEDEWTNGFDTAMGEEPWNEDPEGDDSYLIDVEFDPYSDDETYFADEEYLGDDDES